VEIFSGVVIVSNDVLKGLNNEQKEAVIYTDGPLLVLAGAGSGKTRVLTHKIAYLIKEKNISPEEILAVTFTNKAAEEMKLRVNRLIDDYFSEPWVSTFHSFAARILRKEIKKIGYKNNYIIYDQKDQLKLIKEVLKAINIDHNKTKPKAVLAEIGRAKNELITPAEYTYHIGDFFSEKVNDIYSLYQKKLKANNALDFGDLIMKIVELYQQNPAVLEYYQKRFRYILVDEYQDVNFAQYRLVQLLSGDDNNLCVVGDPDQGIYSFRGADIRNILNFEEDYPDTKIIKLEQNYRSKEKILEAAHNVIKNNIDRKEKKLWTERGPGNNIKLYEAIDEKNEADYVCQQIKKMNSEKYKYGDIAILYRTNAQSRALETMFLKYGIPYQIISGFRFYDRKEIMDVLAYLKVIYNPLDDIGLSRIINCPKRGIGKGTLRKLQNYAISNNISLYQAGLSAEQINDLNGAYLKRVSSFFELMEEFRNPELDLASLTEKVLKDTGYRKELQNENSREAEERLENIKELFSVIKDYMINSSDPDLSGFLEEVSLLSDIDNMQESKQTVMMMTLHAAKGLEFPVVFIVGMEEGIFPHASYLSAPEELEEERRLCYVGITRAMDKLYIVRAKKRMRFGETQYNPPSQFLNEIPPHLFSYNEDNISSSGKNKIQKTSNQKNYKIGQEIIHPKFGRGKIIGLKEKRGLEIKIDFGANNIKTLLAEYAPIQKA